MPTEKSLGGYFLAGIEHYTKISFHRERAYDDEHHAQLRFSRARKIVFGWGRRSELGGLARSLGRRAFLVSGLPEDVGKPLLAEIEALLYAQDIDVLHLATLLHEPEVTDVDRTAANVRASNAGEGDFLLALGGGAAIDLAKAAAAMATNDQSLTIRDYLENVGRDLKLLQAPLPVLAMPTTAGTVRKPRRTPSFPLSIRLSKKASATIG